MFRGKALQNRSLFFLSQIAASACSLIAPRTSDSPHLRAIGHFKLPAEGPGKGRAFPSGRYRNRKRAPPDH